MATGRTYDIMKIFVTTKAGDHIVTMYLYEMCSYVHSYHVLHKCAHHVYIYMLINFLFMIIFELPKHDVIHEILVHALA